MNNSRIRRHTRIRKTVKGIKDVPRLSVYRSNKNMFVQAIDDKEGKTLLGINDRSLKIKGSKMEKARELGKEFGRKALANKITKVVFDRGGYRYHGRVKEFAEGAREAGLQF